MDTVVLKQAVRELRGLLETPTLVVRATTEEPAGLGLTLERSDATELRRLVVEVDAECESLHLDRRTADPSAATPTSRLGGVLLTGAALTRVEESEHPRVFQLGFALPDESAVSLFVEWTGRRNHPGNLRLVDSERRILWTRRKGGPRAGEPYRLPPMSRGRGIDPEPASDSLALALLETPSPQWAECISRLVPEISTPVAFAYLWRLREEGVEADPEIVAQHVLRVLDEDSDADAPVRLYRFAAQQPVAVPFASPGTTATAAELRLPTAAVLHLHPQTLEAFRGSDETTRVLALLGTAHDALLKKRADRALRELYTTALDREMRRLMKARGKIELEGGGLDGKALRKRGQAILSNLHTLRKGDVELRCEDWEAESADAPPLVIELDPRKPPTEVADAYFHRARRWDKGEPIRRRRLQLVDQAIAELSMIRARLDDAGTLPAPEKIEGWMESGLGTLYRPLHSRPEGAAVHAWSSARGDALRPESGRTDGNTGRTAATSGTPRTQSAGRKPNGGGAKGSARGPARTKWAPRTFQTREGWTVVVGRSNEENDYVSHKLARPDDLWFHAHGVPGSHVLLRRDGRKDNPNGKTIEEAASIAAFFSKARNAGRAPVIYTLAKYVRKPRKAKAGLAVCSQEKMVMVAPRNPEEGKPPEWMED